MSAPATNDQATPTRSHSIASDLDRLRAVLAKRPERGVSTARSVSVLGAGLRCRSEERATTLDTDLPAALGGGADGPTPMALLRAALGACLAMGYRLRAAELGVDLTAVRVTVESDADVRGMLDADAGVPAGFLALRAHVELESAAPHADVQRMVELADRLSPMLDVLARATTVERTMSIRRVP